MANFCSKCGEPLSPDAKFCSACGAKVESTVNLSKTTETANTLANDERGNNHVHGGGRVPDKGIYENFLRRDGRLNRWRYFKRLVLLVLVELLVVIVISVATVNMIGELSPRGVVTMSAFFIIWQIPLYCLMTRRLHDIGRDEKLAQFCFAINAAIAIFFPEYNTKETEPSPVQTIISLVAGIIGLYILFCPGTKGANQYGEDPIE